MSSGIVAAHCKLFGYDFRNILYDLDCNLLCCNQREEEAPRKHPSHFYFFCSFLD